MDVERDPLVNANPARKPTEMIVGQNVANTCKHTFRGISIERFNMF